MTLLELSDVHKSFRIPDEPRQTVREHFLNWRPRHFRTLAVLRGINIKLERGETLGVMGRNASGKSTLLKLMAGIYRPNRGQIIRKAPITPILELGVGWNPALDAIDNIHLIGTAMGLTIAELRAATPEILEFADLRGFERLELRHYSSGMAARLAYSVAFRAVRDILILDEIFAVGDIGFRERCYQRYRALQKKGQTMVLVSHNTSDIGNFCDRAILLEEGEIRAEGSGPEIVESYCQILKVTDGSNPTAASAQKSAHR